MAKCRDHALESSRRFRQRIVRGSHHRSSLLDAPHWRVDVGSHHRTTRCPLQSSNPRRPGLVARTCEHHQAALHGADDGTNERRPQRRGEASASSASYSCGRMGDACDEKGAERTCVLTFVEPRRGIREALDRCARTRQLVLGGANGLWRSGDELRMVTSRLPPFQPGLDCEWFVSRWKRRTFRTDSRREDPPA
jgi:hypothetical protein